MIYIGNRLYYAVQLKSPSYTVEENELITRMGRYRIRYDFSHFQQFRFALKLRVMIIRAARDLLSSQAKFANFADSTCNPKYWTLTANGGFKLKQDVQPADAIKDIFQNGPLYAFECATAIVIIFYKAALESINIEQFNRIYQGLYLRDWRSDEDLPINTRKGNDFLPGDCLYFNNPEFDPNVSYWRVENAIDLGNGHFFGHGIGIKTAEKMIEALNSRRKPNATVSAYLLSQVTRLDDQYLYHFASPGLQQRGEPEFIASNLVVGRVGRAVFTG
ncbi:protein-glutamine gamma-glutamyltransferase [Metabacillus malikii]|uniref:Protein-glutamine gamma-glutamyltransferase n=1 Tax=Metabacillus malikii TaxID=1504265 RepID=A0ABT9ZEX5_9BACI|nr:protein-glutamine gamma-glutamyltransferase [Metabacillus malikii]MDQ0229820.1 protein-glutamine gamma-glutamyltransferase [Metabacillus malikii]